MNKYYRLLLILLLFLFNSNLYSQEYNNNEKNNTSKGNKIKQKKTDSSLINARKERAESSNRARTIRPKENIENPERKFSTATKIPKKIHRRTTKEDLQKEIKSLEKQILDLKQSEDINKAAKLEKLYKALEKKKQDLRLKD